MDLLVVGGALAAGFGLGVAVLVVARRRPKKPDAPVEMEIVDDSPATFVPPAPAARAPPPPASTRAHPERAPAMVLTHGVQMADAPLDRRAAAAPAPRAPMREPPPMKTWAQQTREEVGSPIPSEWARRQVGPLEPGRTKGACGGCGAALSVSTQRPLRIACPVCGRTKLLAA